MIPTPRICVFFRSLKTPRGISICSPPNSLHKSSIRVKTDNSNKIMIDLDRLWNVTFVNATKKVSAKRTAAAGPITRPDARSPRPGVLAQPLGTILTRNQVKFLRSAPSLMTLRFRRIFRPSASITRSASLSSRWVWDILRTFDKPLNPAGKGAGVADSERRRDREGCAIALHDPAARFVKWTIGRRISLPATPGSTFADWRLAHDLRASMILATEPVSKRRSSTPA